MNASVQGYLNARQRGNNPYAGPKLSSSSYDRVRRMLIKFEKWIDGSLLLINEREAQVINDQINGYKDKLSKAWMRSILRSFYEWATSEGLYDGPNYFWFVERTDEFGSSGEISSMPLKDIRRLMDAASTLKDKDQALTYQLMIGLIGLAGLRFGELGDIRKEDILTEGIVVRRDNRFVPLSADLLKLLKKSAKQTDSEFVLHRVGLDETSSEPLTDNYVQKHLNKFIKSSGVVDQNYVPYSLRKGFIDELNRVTDDSTLVYTLAGHSRTTTQPLRPLFTKKELVETYKKVVSE